MRGTHGKLTSICWFIWCTEPDFPHWNFKCNIDNVIMWFFSCFTYQHSSPSWYCMVFRPHRDPSVFSFLEVSSETTYVGTSYGPCRTLNNFRLNPNRTSCWDRAPGDPRGVPWDQKFGLEKFLISSSNELILWVLWIGYAKNDKNQEKLLILAWFLSNKGKSWKQPNISCFSWFLAFLA